MKRILFIAINCDVSKQDGGGLATLAYLNAFCNLYPKIIDVMIPEEIQYDNLEGEIIRIPRRSKFLRLPYLLLGSLHRGASFIPKYLHQFHDKYSLVIINGGIYGGKILKTCLKYNLGSIIIHHNFEREYYRDSHTAITFGRYFLNSVIKNERLSYLDASINLFLTDYDKNTFEHYYGKRKSNYYIGIFEPYEIERFQGNAQKDNSIALSCSLNATQNIISTTMFINKYISSIKRVYPYWKLRLIGRNPSKDIIKISDLHKETIEIIPNPTNISIACSKSKIYICAIEIGGGLKLRVMDGLRIGMPILIHKNSLRGYEIFQNSPFFKVYDDIESFEKNLTETIEYINSETIDPKEIQDLYFSHFGFTSGVKRLRDIIDKDSNRLFR